MPAMQTWRDQELAELAARGRGYSRADHEQLARWLAAQPGRLIELWRTIASLPEVEIATSPYAHPILPLLIDTAVVARQLGARAAARGAGLPPAGGRLPAA